MSEENTTETTESGEQTTETQPEALGDAGKKALSTERDARKAAEKSAKEAADKLTELEAEISRLRRSNAAQKGTDLDALREEMRDEFTSKLLAADIKAEAKGRVIDPAEVSKRYPEYFENISAGDSEAITAAIEKLLKEKPYLAAETPSSGPRPWGDVGGGTRSSSRPEPANAQERLKRAYTKE